MKCYKLKNHNIIDELWVDPNELVEECRSIYTVRIVNHNKSKRNKFMDSNDIHLLLKKYYDGNIPYQFIHIDLFNFEDGY